MPSPRDLRIMLVLAVAFSALGVAVELYGASPDLLLLGPLLCLAIPLLGGRYVGEETLARLAAAVAGRPRRRVSARAQRTRRAPLVIARASSVLGSAHAIRPPPAHLLTH